MTVRRPRVRFRRRVNYSRIPTVQELRSFGPFIDHVDTCQICIDGLEERRTPICRIGHYLGKAILTQIYYDEGDVYSSFDWDVNRESVRLELGPTLEDIRHLAEIYELRIEMSFSKR